MESLLWICGVVVLVGVYCSGYLAGSLHMGREHIRELRKMVERADAIHLELSRAFAVRHATHDESGGSDGR